MTKGYWAREATAVLVLGGGLTWCATGCVAGARGPSRNDAAAIVVSLSGAVRVADHTCALVALETSSYALAERCADHYGAAREALLAAALGLDTWDTDRERSACAVLSAVSHVRELGPVSTSVSTALNAATLLAAPLCSRGAQ